MFSFYRERKRLQLQALVRRIADLTSPNLPPLRDDPRTEPRNNRCLTTMLVPLRSETVVAEEVTTAVTKDISDRGLSLILPAPYEGNEVVVGFWLRSPHLAPHQPELYFLRGRVRHCADLGGGHWQVGLELQEIITSQRIIRALQPLAVYLLPPSVQHALQPPA